MISFEGRLAFASDPTPNGVRILRFEPTGDPFPLHHAGQYALLEFPSFSPRPYSVANAANGHTLEFHVRSGHSGAGAYATSELKTGDVIPISGYGGGCLYQADCTHPLLLVAGGTGLAPLLAIMEQALIDAPERPVMIYHGGRSKSDLYAHQKLEELTHIFPSLSYSPVLSHDEEGGIAHGLVGDVALSQRDDFSMLRLYCSGPVEMMRHTQDLALSFGVHPDFIHSDLQEFPLPLPKEVPHER
ncbi:MAG TPA: hypothetical protein PKI93_00270 [Alphaproteobacteria bacterium]|nr:hypothetical protein [Alphaproteobacteria bacterium]HNS44696.1 hypothetical protein [Alphaproteobacteria bacterium]